MAFLERKKITIDDGYFEKNIEIFVKKYLINELDESKIYRILGRALDSVLKEKLEEKEKINEYFKEEFNNVVFDNEFSVGQMPIEYECKLVEEVEKFVKVEEASKSQIFLYDLYSFIINFEHEENSMFYKIKKLSEDISNSTDFDLYYKLTPNIKESYHENISIPYAIVSEKYFKNALEVSGKKIKVPGSKRYYKKQDVYQKMDIEYVTKGRSINQFASNIISIKKEDLPPKQFIERKTKNLKRDYLKEQIRARYAMIDRPRNGLSNVIVDSFFPRIAYASNLEAESIRSIAEETLPKTAVAISPFIANALGVQRMQPVQIAASLGYDIKTIKQLLRKVKSKNIDFVFAGMGGTGINTTVWLSEMCKMTGITNLFNRVYVYEKEDADISNLLRFPLDVESIRVGRDVGFYDLSKKVNLVISEINLLSKLKPSFLDSYMFDNETKVYYYYNDMRWIADNYYKMKVYNVEETRYNGGKKELKNGLFKNGSLISVDDVEIELRESYQYARHGDQEKVKYEIKPNTVVYGAPALEYRGKFSDAGRFICGTHNDNSCSLKINPTNEDINLQVESYGMIQLGGFFMNQFRMAIGLLELLADDSVDLTEKNIDYLDFEFNGECNRKADRKYNWQLQNNGMLTEEEANNIL